MSKLRIGIAAGLAVCACFALSHTLVSGPVIPSTPLARVNENAEQGARLQAAARTALGQREGAIVVVDPQTGYVRTLVNQELAFQTAFPPGSTIKPFTALAALRARVIAPGTRIRCRGKYKRSDAIDACSHPHNFGPFNTSEALAYSCNYYFATVGERLKEDDISRLLADFGFGQKTGIDVEEESPGMLARGRWQTESAVGEGGFLQVTPVQMAMAYAALLNGGKLLRPTFKSDLTPQLRAQLQISDEERTTLLTGMRGAVEFGTADQAGLDSLPAYVAGKTGTATPLQGFRTQGWFAGVVFASDGKPEPAKVQLVVVVYLKHGHGAEAAAVARSVFAEFLGVQPSTTYVTVKQVSEGVTRTITLEDYIRQVIATEASIEDEPEALKALAIAARTYALKNLGRHRDEGYDFCSTTHCQRFGPGEARPAVTAAVRDTSGLVLRDDRDEMIDAYYSASCGGMTANLKSIWGMEAPEYLRGVRDSYCNTGSHYRWTDAIPSAKLVHALRSDPRTDVGETVRQISVAKYDRTGRAELISIAGDRRREINGWDFKLIVGRALGWQWLKSSRFTVSRSGSEFVFRGAGFGHGLGLCQEGSHVMAQRGQTFQQILAHYFPGTSVSSSGGETRGWGDDATVKREEMGRTFAFARNRVSPSPRVPVAVARLSSSHFRLTYPRSVEQREAEEVLSLLESARTELLRRVSSGGIQFQFPDMEVIVDETTGDFVGRTGMPPWAAAATKSNRIEIQPLRLLKQRRILETTLRHELVHALIDAIGGGETPRWLAEGMAIHIAGEGRLMPRDQHVQQVEMVERALGTAKSKSEMQTAYAAAYNLVQQLIQREGERKIWQRIADRSYSVKAATTPTLRA